MVSKADKDNSVLILYQEEHNQKVEEFISNNNFTVVKTNITKKLQRTIRSTVITAKE
jgi:maleate cis-trans isomerase